MPLDRPLTAADILNYVPSDEQRQHGFRTYASRLMVEGVRFEKAGNALQAKLRYEKCKAYCKLRGVAFPPFSEGKTDLIVQVEQAPEVQAEWVRGEKVVTARPTKNNLTGLKPKKKKGKKEWGGDRDACKVRGQMVWFNRLLSQGQSEAAAAFAHRHNLPVAGQLSVARTSVQRDSETGSAVIPHSTPGTESSLSDGETGNQQEQAGEPSTALPPPSESLPLAKLTLREQLIRQIAEMDAAERAAGAPMVAPASIAPEVNPVVEPVKDEAREKWLKSQQTYEDVLAYQAALPKVEVVFPPPAPVPAPVVVPNSPAGVRQAKVFNFVVNPRLIRIQFTDLPPGSPPEYASMLIDRVGLRMNDKLEVIIAEGSHVNPIYRETRKRT